MRKFVVVLLVFFLAVLFAGLASAAPVGSGITQNQSGTVFQKQNGTGLNLQGYAAVGGQGYVVAGTATRLGFGSGSSVTGVAGAGQGTGMLGFQGNLGKGQSQMGFYKNLQGTEFYAY